jgi:hypothetical protein
MGRGPPSCKPHDGRSQVVITLSSPLVRGVVDGDLLEIDVGLEAEGLPWPDAEWIALFREYRDFPADLEEPRLDHGKLRFEARDDDLRRAWTEVKERVAATNRMYGELLVPRDRSDQRSEDARRDDLAERIGAAQHMLDSLN